MTAPRWTRALLRRFAPPERADDVLGDLEETHRTRVAARGRMLGTLLTIFETLDMALTLRWQAGRGRQSSWFSWLDIKLGFRMLAKYPGLTVISTLGMAVAIAMGAGYQGFVSMTLDPDLPFDEGDRIVGIRNWNVGWSDPDYRSVHDFANWRLVLRSIDDVGAFRTVTRNVIPDDGPPTPMTLAEMTGSAFRVARVSPLLGRAITEDDERTGAPPVVVLGHDVWQRHFKSDPYVLGRGLRMGTTIHTIVGVMPQGFHFPLAHSLWTPLRVDSLRALPRPGPSIYVFGRLAPSVNRAQAQGELSTIARDTTAFSTVTERLQARIVSFPMAVEYSMEDDALEIRMILLLPIAMMVVVCVNVAVLVYARTATRQGEIAMRTALGASRRRIIRQLFAEALVLSLLAAAIGLGIVGFSYRYLSGLLGPWGAPFWWDLRLSPTTVVSAILLAVAAAAIVGILPALRATGRTVQATLRQLGGGTGLQLGKTWSALIVAQVTIAVAVLPGVLLEADEAVRIARGDPGFAAEGLVTARLEVEWAALEQSDSTRAVFRRRLDQRLSEIKSRLEADPAFARVTMASGLPRHDWRVRMSADTGDVDSQSGRDVRILEVDSAFFDVFTVTPLMGRRFQPFDFDTSSTSVIVNRAFVEEILGGGPALGQRVQDVETDSDRPIWYDIIGVVENLPVRARFANEALARMYRPMAPGTTYPAYITARIRNDDPAASVARLREIVVSLDPTVQVHQPLPLAEFYRVGEPELARLGFLAMALIALSGLLLSGAGIHALMSFTVTRRRREIGIRSALGADARQLLAGVFARAIGQLALGGSLGAAALIGLDWWFSGHVLGEKWIVLPMVMGLMFAVGIVAALGPARRGLRIQPTEALKESAG